MSTISLRQPFYGDFPITLGFGEECLPLYKAGQHMGIDYGCPLGTMILASADGIVHTVGEMPAGYGKYVIISHGNGKYQTLYAHLSQILVKEWQKVECGEIIALSGSTGKSTGPHLHFELIEYGRKIDAKPYLKCVVDDAGYNSTPSQEKPKFDTVRVGKCIVVCDGANARCHCDMSRVMRVLPKGTEISVGDQVTMYNGLPYRDYYDSTISCWLRVAEHDPYVQMLRNSD